MHSHDKFTHRIGVNQSVMQRLPKLPAKNVYASFWRTSSARRHGQTRYATYLERILASEDSNERHVNNRYDGTTNPELEVNAPEPILLSSCIDQEQPKA